MSDAQLKQKAFIKRLIIVSLLLLLASGGLVYFRIATQDTVDIWEMEKAQEESVQMSIDHLTASNATLLSIIEENGKQLVSFTEDKLKYVNLASSLSKEYDVRINKLNVSDVWTEGEMLGMTTLIEVEGNISNVRTFIENYCSVNYTNRINVVSCRPNGRYIWLTRTIDGQQVLSWFDLAEDEALYAAQQAKLEQEEGSSEMQAVSDANGGLPVTHFGSSTLPSTSLNVDEDGREYKYDYETGKFIYIDTQEEVSQEVLDASPITLEKLFADTPIRAYLIIDFLGRE